MGVTNDQIANVNEEEIVEQPKNERPAGQVEGTAGEPDTSEVAALYKDLGIKAPVPTGKAKGRPKTADVRGKKSEENGTGSADSKRQKAENADDEDESTDARASNKNGSAGNKADAKGSQNGSNDDGVQDESGDANKGVRGAESRNEEDSKRGREEDANGRASGNESAEHDANGEAEGESDDEEAVKRPGKSNPEVERRMQRLAAERKEAIERAERAERQLQETARKREQERVEQEDPEYTIDDFRRVRDNDSGEIIELDPERAELAWRRWKEGYEGRREEREAKQNYAARVQEQAETEQREMMQKSVEAYDALAALQDEYPELVSNSGKFDPEFAADAMPIIQESIEYLPGTEPGNPDDNLPVIVGLRIDPKKILNALKGISNKKRSLPLNGVNDNVESGSNVSVPHSRSSDPTVHAANELYKELGINKRI